MVSSKALFLPLLALGLVACGAGPEGEPKTALAKAEPVRPKPARLAAGYRIRTRLDAATSGLFGNKVGATLLSLKEMKTNPSHTATQLLAIYKVPGAEVLSHLPGPIRSRFEGWVNEELARVGSDGMTPITRASQVVDGLLELTRVVVLESELAPESREGAARGRHSVKGLGFSALGRTTVVPLPAEAAGLIATETPGLSLGIEPPSLRIEAHDFAIPLGEMTLTAAHELFVRPAGAESLDALLEKAVGCGDIAKGIGDHCMGKCVSDFVSVETLTGLCKSGVSVVVHKVEDEIRAQRLTMLSVREGHCGLAVGTEGVATSLVDGHFTIGVKAEGEMLTGDAPFDGQEIPPNGVEAQTAP